MEKLRRVLALLLCLLLALPLAIAEENDAPAICVEEEIAAAIEALPEPETEPVPEPTAEATPEITVSVLEPTPEAEIAPTAEATAAPSAEAAAGATAAPAPEAGQEATPVPQPEATLDPTPEVLPEPTAVPYPRMVADDGEVVLGVKEKHALQVGFDDGAVHELRYISLDKEVAKISNSGVITAISVGETEMMIESEFGESISVPVTVKKAPSKLALNVKELHLGEGQSFQLLVSMPEDSAGALEWVSEKPKVASVDENGLVSACGAGAVYMRAECYNGEYASLMVYVYAAPEEISMRDAEIILGVGQPHTIALDSKLPQESYEFTSDHPEIVSVSANGAISALSAGEAVITASTYNGLSAECRVVVKPAPESIAFREQEIVICAKDSYSVQPLLSEGSEGTGYTLKSASRRFRLDGNRITAHSVGSSSLTVTTYNGHSASVALRCVAAPKSVAFDSEECTLFLGTEMVPGLSAACSYTLESSNPAVVVVDGRRIRAVAAGDAQIRATTYNKKTAVLNVHVPPLPESLALQEAALVLGCGDTYQLNPIIPEGQGSSFRFESSDPAVVSVGAAGRAEALRPGSAALTVHALNGLSASCEITVLEAPTAVSLSPARVVRSVEQGGFDLAICFGGEGEGGRYTIEISDPTVAAVAPDGRVTPLAPGSAVISIVTYNGLTAAARVTLGEQPSAMTFSGDLRIALGDCVLPGLIFDRGCESYILESGNPDVVQVEGDSIRAAAIGNTILRAESVGGLTAECRVAVVEPPTGIELSHSEEKLVLGVNPSLQLVGSALSAGVGSIRYASSNPAIAAVDAGGLVTALAMGDCIIQPPLTTACTVPNALSMCAACWTA